MIRRRLSWRKFHDGSRQSTEDGVARQSWDLADVRNIVFRLSKNNSPLNRKLTPLRFTVPSENTS
jgi:hypothetical protein